MKTTCVLSNSIVIPNEIVNKIFAKKLEDRFVVYSYDKRHHKPVPHNLLKAYDQNNWELPLGMKERLDFYMPGLTYSDTRIAPTMDKQYNAVSLYDYQEKAQAACLKALNDNGTALLKSPCGSGKTRMMISIAQQLAVKTLVVVPSKALAEQFAEDVEGLLGFTPGFYLDGQTDYSQDITITTIHSLLLMSRKVLNTFGMALFDEVHRKGAEEWNKGISRLNCRYKMGASATPEREDKRHVLVFAAISDITYEVPRKILEERGYILRPEILFVRYPKRAAKYTGKGKRLQYSYPNTCTEIGADHKRNDLILKLLFKANAAGRHSFVLSNRIDHIDSLYEAAKGHGLSAATLKSGDDRKAALGATNTFGINSLIKEGINKNILSTMFVTIPISDVPMLEQIRDRTNRSMRDGQDKPHPRVVHIVDSVFSLKDLANPAQRKRLDLDPVEKAFVKNLEFYMSEGLPIKFMENGTIYAYNKGR